MANEGEQKACVSLQAKLRESTRQSPGSPQSVRPLVAGDSQRVGPHHPRSLLRTVQGRARSPSRLWGHWPRLSCGLPAGRGPQPRGALSDASFAASEGDVSRPWVLSGSLLRLLGPGGAGRSWRSGTWEFHSDKAGKGVGVVLGREAQGPSARGGRGEVSGHHRLQEGVGWIRKRDGGVADGAFSLTQAPPSPARYCPGPQLLSLQSGPVTPATHAAGVGVGGG